MEGLNDTSANLLASIDRDEGEISPSTLYAVACVEEGVPYINGAPQNTFVPGLIDFAVSVLSYPMNFSRCTVMFPDELITAMMGRTLHVLAWSAFGARNSFD